MFFIDFRERNGRGGERRRSERGREVEVGRVEREREREM